MLAQSALLAYLQRHPDLQDLQILILLLPIVLQGLFDMAQSLTVAPHSPTSHPKAYDQLHAHVSHYALSQWAA